VAATSAPDAASKLDKQQKADADKLFAQLKKEAEDMIYNYVLARVPMELHDYFVEENPPPVAPPPMTAAA
jgi:hypothetical protein